MSLSLRHQAARPALAGGVCVCVGVGVCAHMQVSLWLMNPSRQPQKTSSTFTYSFSLWKMNGKQNQARSIGETGNQYKWWVNKKLVCRGKDKWCRVKVHATLLVEFKTILTPSVMRSDVLIFSGQLWDSAFVHCGNPVSPIQHEEAHFVLGCSRCLLWASQTALIFPVLNRNRCRQHLGQGKS